MKTCKKKTMRISSFAKKPDLTESQVVEIWKRSLNRKQLVSLDGERIEVKYPGRLNDDRGADFRDAVLVTSQGLRTGHIEIHSLTSGWQDHNHHRDPV
jgi:hypothetical protein